MAMIQEGKKAPEFVLSSSEGGEVSLKGLKGKHRVFEVEWV